MTEIKNTSVIDFSDISDEQMNEMIDGTLTEFDEGDLVDGTVVKIEHDEVLVDIGFKSEGVIPSRELSIRKDADPSDIVSLGDKIEALVLQKEDKDGRLILSKKRAEYERAWISVEEKFKAGEVVTGEVIEVVKGGLILDIGLRGFLSCTQFIICICQGGNGIRVGGSVTLDQGGIPGVLHGMPPQLAGQKIGDAKSCQQSAHRSGLLPG